MQVRADIPDWQRRFNTGKADVRDWRCGGPQRTPEKAYHRSAFPGPCQTAPRGAAGARQPIAAGRAAAAPPSSP